MAYQMSERNRKRKPYSVPSGDFAIRLDANESFFDPGLAYAEEMAKAIQNVPLNRYPEDSSLKLREAFGALYSVDPERVVAGNGSDELIALIIGAFLSGEETLLVCEPDFSMYRIFAENYGRKAEFAQKSPDFSMDPEELLARAKATDARVLIFSNPGSYGGKVIKREDVIRILDHTEALVVVDEAYMDFSDQSVLDLTGQRDNLVVLRTCSKALSCAALRLGFAVSSKEITDVLNSLRPPYNINSLSQAAGCLILSKQDEIGKTISKIVHARDELYHSLLAFAENEKVKKVCRSDTNFIFLETDHGDFLYEELKRRSILVRSFGKAIRITAGNQEENRALILALEEILGHGRGKGGQS